MALGVSRIFRSTDAGAPVFTNNVAGSFTNLLKSVLVNGYGSTASLGWTLEYDLSNISVFRMKSGTKTFIRFDDSTYNSVGAVEVSAFSTMSSRDNGTERIPTFGSSAYIRKLHSTFTGASPWIIIGDDAGVWIIYRYMATYVAHPTYCYRYAAVYFGDYNAWDVKNKWNFLFLPMTMAQPPTLTSDIPGGLHVHTTAVSNNRHFVARGATFTKGCVLAGFLPFSNNTYFGQNVLAVPYAYGAANSRLNGVYMQSPIHVYDANAVLGSLPGVYEPVMQDLSATITQSSVAPVEIVDANGEISMLLYIVNNVADISTSDKVIFKVGKGFRNVQ